MAIQDMLAQGIGYPPCHDAVIRNALSSIIDGPRVSFTLLLGFAIARKYKQFTSSNYTTIVDNVN